MPSLGGAADFCKLLAEAARRLSATEPLRFLAKRKAPLLRDGEALGHLELVLRLSFYGEGRGTGVLVFEWPKGAEDHSVVRKLEGWIAQCQDRPGGGDSLVELERKEVATQGEASTPLLATHCKVKFPLADVPEAMHGLISLALQVKLGDEARQAIERRLELEEKKAKVQAVEHRTEAPPTPRNGAAKPAKPLPDQAKIDAITANSVFDAAVHPQVDLNEQVTNSKGDSFRLVVKRHHGGPMRHMWIKIPHSVAKTDS